MPNPLDGANDRADRRGPRAGVSFLAEASRLLASSLDYEETLRTVAGLALPHLGAWCIVDIVEADDAEPTVRRLAIVHPDPEKQRLARRLEESWPPEREDPIGAPAVVRTRESEVVARVTDALLRRVARNERNLADLRALGIGSFIVVPLIARDRVLGAMTFISPKRGRTYDEGDRLLAEDLAARCALAIDNARHYRDARRATREAEQRAEQRTEQAERRTAEAEAARRRFRELVEDVDAIVWEADAQTWEFLYVNRRAEEILGYPVERWLTEPDFWINTIHPEDRERSVSYCLECTRRGEHHEFEYRAVRADGGIVWLRDIVRVIKDEEGVAYRLRGVMVDITERKRAEQRTRLAERRLSAQYAVARALVLSDSVEDAAPEILRVICESLGWRMGALWYVDDEAGVIRCGELWMDPDTAASGFAETRRRSRFERGVDLPGRIWARREAVWIPDVTTDPDLPRTDAAAGAGLHAAFGVPVFSDDDVVCVLEFFSSEIREPDGRLLDLMRATAAQIGQTVRRTRAEEALRRSERAERFLADASAILSSSLDYDRTLSRIAHLAVPRLADLCTIDVVDDGDGRLRRVQVAHADGATRTGLKTRAATLAPPPEWEQHPIIRAVRTGESVFVPEVTDEWLRRAVPGAEHRALLRDLCHRSLLSVPFVARGEVHGAITLCTPEPARRLSANDRALAEELARRAASAIDNARLYRSALEASRAKSDFLAVMSHELRTPLNAILGYVDLLLMNVPEPLPESSREQALRVRSSAHQLLRLIEELLTFSRTETGEATIRLQRVEIAEVVRGTAELIRPLAAEKGLEFRVHMPEGPVVMRTDAARVRQILTNLLSNAVKFTEGGSIELTVEARQDDVVFRVRDTGRGISPEDLDHIFEPFWQVERGTTREVRGTGLGLSVTHRLAELLGGTVTVESTAGAGSTFTVRLPRRSERPAPTTAGTDEREAA